MNILTTKRFTALLIILLIIVSLTACGGGSNNPAQSTYTVSGQIIDGDGRGVKGVTIHFSGGFGTAETDNKGEWNKSGLKGEVEISPAKSEVAVFDPNKVTVDRKENVNFKILLYEENLEEINNTYGSIERKVNDLYDPADRAHSLTQIAQDVQDLPGIKNAEGGGEGLLINFENGGSVSWHYQDFISGTQTQKTEKIDNKVSKLSNIKQQDIIENKRALLINTLSEDDSYQNTRTLFNDIEKVLKGINFEVNLINAPEADLDLFKKLDEYGFIFLHGHGNLIGDKIIFETGENTEQIRFTNPDWLNDRVHYGFPGGNIAITNKFIEDYNSDFADSIIISYSCHSLEKDYMAQAFVQNGAQSYMGWTNITGENDFIVDGKLNLVKNLAKGDSLSKAYNKLDSRIKDGFNYDLPGWFGEKGQTNFEYYPQNSGDAKLIDASKYNLIINIEGNGHVELDGKEINLPFSKNFNEDEVINLKAVSDSETRFFKWKGNIKNQDNPKINLNMTEDKEITAVFTEKTGLEILMYYGHKPLGNWWDGIDYYSEIRQELRDAGYSVNTNNTEPLSTFLLSSYDIVMMHTPTEDFNQAELDAVADFADGGIIAGGGNSIYDNESIDNLDNRKFAVQLINKLKKNTDKNILVVYGEHGKMHSGDHNVYNQLLNPTGLSNPAIEIEDTKVIDSAYNWFDDEGDRSDWPIASTVFNENSELLIVCKAVASLDLTSDAVPLVRASQDSYVLGGQITEIAGQKQGPEGISAKNSDLNSSNIFTQQYDDFKPNGEVVFAYYYFAKD